MSAQNEWFYLWVVESYIWIRHESYVYIKITHVLQGLTKNQQKQMICVLEDNQPAVRCYLLVTRLTAHAQEEKEIFSHELFVL